MSYHPLPLLATCTALIGCGSTVTLDTPKPIGLSQPAPTLSRTDVTAFDAQAHDLSLAQRTFITDLPTGSVTYDGQLGSNIRLNGQSGYGMLGDMRMSVDFTDGNIGGNVRNINLLQNGTPIQRFGGQLVIDGQEFAGTLEADADGILSLISDNGIRQRTNIAIDLDGQVINDVFVGDAVTGTASGFGDGYQLSGDTFNVLLDGNGTFLGVVD